MTHNTAMAKKDFLWLWFKLHATLVIRGLINCELVTCAKIALEDKFPVKNRLFICEFKIHVPKWHNAFTANNEGNLRCNFYGYCRPMSSQIHA